MFRFCTGYTTRRVRRHLFLRLNHTRVTEKTIICERWLTLGLFGFYSSGTHNLCACVRTYVCVCLTSACAYPLRTGGYCRNVITLTVPWSARTIGPSQCTAKNQLFRKKKIIKIIIKQNKSLGPWETLRQSRTVPPPVHIRNTYRYISVMHGCVKSGIVKGRGRLAAFPSHTDTYTYFDLENVSRVVECRGGKGLIVRIYRVITSVRGRDDAASRLTRVACAVAAATVRQFTAACQSRRKPTSSDVIEFDALCSL